MAVGPLKRAAQTGRANGLSRWAATRVLVLTARSRAQDLAAGPQAGADASLTKPFSPLQLTETIAHLLNPG